MAIKKVIIAAAGKGTRMLHLTKNKCKHLIRVCNRPFLAYLLDNLLKAGYKEIILVVGYKADQIRNFLKEYKYDNVKVIDQYAMLGEKEYGTACPLKCAKQEVAKSQFLFVCGDNLYSVKDLRAMNIDDKYNYVAGLHHKHPEKYGVLIAKGDLLEKIVEKPKEPVGDLINTGLYKFTPEVFDKLSKIKRSIRGEYEITDVITMLAKENKVKVKEIKDYWLDFGNPADIIKLSRFLKKSKDFQK